MIITFVGLASVGKTSIVKRVLNNYSIDEVKGIRPTVFKEIQDLEPSWLQKNVNVVDLGGQSSYLQLHVKNYDFSESDIVIFVVDVQNVSEATVERATSYFTAVAEKLRSVAPPPLVGFLLHKFDPDRKKELLDNIKPYLHIIRSGSLSGLNPIVFMTSVYDRSIHTAVLTLILRSTQSGALIHALGEVAPSSWSFFSSTTQSSVILQQLAEQGKHDGLEFRRTWVDCVFNEGEPKWGVSTGFKIQEENGSLILLTNCYDLSIPSHETLTPCEILASYVRELVKPLFLSLVRFETSHTTCTFFLSPLPLNQVN